MVAYYTRGSAWMQWDLFAVIKRSIWIWFFVKSTSRMTKILTVPLYFFNNSVRFFQVYENLRFCADFWQKNGKLFYIFEALV
jgi:hypothetical protein